jgi:hypothetical protein
MALGIAAQLGDGSIQTLDAAAPWRLADALRLHEAGRRGGALYLYGYVGEMRLCAACFRLYGYGVREPIDRDKRKALEKDARRLSLMSSQPHDIAGWARYLVHLRRLRSTGYARGLRGRIIEQAEALYEQWRPELRYHALVPSATQLAVVRSAAEWLDQNYPRLWN